MPRRRDKLESLTPGEKRALIARALARRRTAGASGDEAQRTGLLFTPSPAPAAPRRLICIPGLGAGASFFAGWPDALAPDFEVHVVRLPGREALLDAPAFADLDAATRALLDAVSAVTEQPYALLGHSMGGHLAFHLATHLARMGRPPTHVFVCGAAGPGASDDLGSIDDYDDDALIRALWTEPGGPDDALSAEERASLLRCARADAALDAQLRDVLDASAQPASFPVTAVAGRRDEAVPAGSMVAWADATTASFCLHVVDDAHAFVRTRAPQVQRIVRDVLLGAHPRGPALHGDEVDAQLGFGLFFFSCNEADFEGERYALVERSVELADRAGFTAAWIPERHFHPVGGLFPNPSVVAAALAVRTERIRLRSGSVVLPLHDPLRVAEEWSVVDNLSRGRVELAFVPGWNPNDYVLAPDDYEDRWAVMVRKIDAVQRLWRGETIARRNGIGAEAQVRVFPGPVQPELPLWLTTSARDETFVRAGELGANVLTALLIQSVDDLARRIDMYRQARADAGHDPDGGRVALMVHTFVGADEDEVRRTVREPFIDYMHSVQSLWKDQVASLRVDTDAERAALIDMVFERYFQRSTLFGDHDECVRRAQAFLRAGVDEIACAIDFGVPLAATMQSIHRLDRVRRHFAGGSR